MVRVLQFRMANRVSRQKVSFIVRVSGAAIVWKVYITNFRADIRISVTENELESLSVFKPCVYVRDITEL